MTDTKPVKLIIQIPSLNESDSIGEVIDHLPKAIPGVDIIEVQIIDDGCTDDTVAVALAHGAHHIVHHPRNKGLAAAYQSGVDSALALGADIIVNTDGDHQYPGDQIPLLVGPIVRGEADIVIGDRQVGSNENFSQFKRWLQHVGSAVVRWASGTDVPDTVSGFRALSREAALRTFVTNDFSYTVENLIQAGKRRLIIDAVPIRTNPNLRKSRLHRGNWNFIKRQAAIIARAYATYEPLKTFSYIAGFFAVVGTLFLLRAGYVFIGRRLGWFEASNDQALLIGSVLMIISFLAFLVALLADRIGGVRRLEEEVLYRIRSMQVNDNEWRRGVHRRLDDLEGRLGNDDTVIIGRSQDSDTISRR